MLGMLVMMGRVWVASGTALIFQKRVLSGRGMNGFALAVLEHRVT